MNVTFSHFAQIRQKAGVESETVDVADGADWIREMAEYEKNAQLKRG